MALTQGSKISAADFIALHDRVLAEIARRSTNNAVGSMSSWTAAAAYTTDPTNQGKIQIEHANKIINPVNAIKASGMSTVVAGSAITNFTNLISVLGTLETASKKEDKTGSGHGCAASCTGLCSTGCYSGCSSCGGSCSNNCSSGCTGDCEGSCSGSCSGTCTNSCGQGCASCYTACGSACTGKCSNDCATGCSETCEVLAGKS